MQSAAGSAAAGAVMRSFEIQNFEKLFMSEVRIVSGLERRVLAVPVCGEQQT